MLFNSVEFAFFLPLVFIIYWLLPHKLRWVLLLVSSYYFYMSWNASYVVLILFTTAVSYFCALLVERTQSIKYKKLYVAAGVLLSLIVLFFFKYFNFASHTLDLMLSKFAIPIHPVTLSLLLPVGISFYTFQSLGYVVDVYRGEVKAERHFGKYATFISFFPQLVAGPIERTKNLLPQIDSPKKFDYKGAVYGLRLMLIGFIKKLLIADVVGKYVDLIFNDVKSYQGLTFIIAAILFAFQIYCDFSGYSDIAIGTARLMGIHLMTNFKSPYFSGSIKEFWSRWHISLSTWFRDYVYIPLGGNKVSPARRNFNLLLTFLASGLWHGANFTYIVWGGLHGLFQIAEKMTFKVIGHGNNKNFQKEPSQPVFIRGAAVVVTFIFICFAWIFFRAESLSDAFYVIAHLFSDFSVSGMLSSFVMKPVSFLKIVVMLCLLMLYDYMSLKRDLLLEMDKLKPPVRWGIYLGIVVVMIVLKIHNGTSQEFIYFQF